MKAQEKPRLLQQGAISHNQLGQRLGRKGLATRERVVSAMLHLLNDPDGPPLTLTAVAREASIGLPNLYLYFPGLTDLLLAALQKVMESQDPDFVEIIRQRWPDSELEESCRTFVRAHFDFWKRHARLLHLRDALADANDQRILDYRYFLAKPVMDDLTAQMDAPDGRRDPMAPETATMLFTGLERIATIYTNQRFLQATGRADDLALHARVVRQLDAEARLFSLAIRDRRETATRK